MNLSKTPRLCWELKNWCFFPLCYCCSVFFWGGFFQQASTLIRAEYWNVFFFLSLALSQRVLEADAAEDAFNDDDDYEVDTPKRRHRGKGRVSDHLESDSQDLRRIALSASFLQPFCIGSGCFVHTRGAKAMLKLTYACWKPLGVEFTADGYSIWMLLLRVGVQAAGRQIWMTTSHMSVTVSRDETWGLF